MKKGALVFALVAGMLTACAVEIKCTGCNAKVLPGDKFCPNCGARFAEPSRVEPPTDPSPAPQYQPPSPKPKVEQSEYWNEVENHKPGHALPVPMGMLRGLAEIACTPIEFGRTLVGAECMIWESEIRRKGNPVTFLVGTVFATPVVTCVVGSIRIVSDVGMGSLDILSLGTIGNAFWDSDSNSPYVFERNWTEFDHPTRGVWL